MLSDNALSERLNAVKNGKTPPIPQNNDAIIESLLHKEDQNFNKASILVSLLMSFINIADVVFASILYGYGIKVLYSIIWGPIPWTFIEVLGIGFLLNSIVSAVPSFISKIYKKITS